LDGWWEEGCIDKVNGWSIGESNLTDDEADANSLYNVLEKEVIPVFYTDRSKWISMMKNAIKTGVNFTSQRMVQDYLNKYYT